MSNREATQLLTQIVAQRGGTDAATAADSTVLRGMIAEMVAQAEQELAAALEIAKEIGNPPQLWKTHAAIGALRLAQGRPDEARAAYRDALSVIDDVAAKLEDESLRETFLKTNTALAQGRRPEGSRSC